MAKFGQTPSILTCKSGTFMCYTSGQKVWKFHGQRSGDKMPGEDQFSGPVLVAETRVHKKPPLNLVNLETRRLGRSTSTGSCSGSESECSSQPSPISESPETASSGFPSPPSTPISSDTPEQEAIKFQCPPPSPIERKNKVDIKVLSDLINALLKKHSLVQNGLELLKQKPALALRLQQRRPRKVLADQGIIPPLKSPAAYYEQIQKLERARTGDFLNKKMQDRPERESLVQKHILEDTNAYDSLVAHQKELRKAQLADDLNEKIFYRPGVFELVEKNILPADESVAEALKEGHVQYKKTAYDFDEDSSDAFSPEQPSMHSQAASPPPSFSPSSMQTAQPSGVNVSSWAVVCKPDSIVTSSSSKMSRSVSSTHSTAGHPYLMRQASGNKSSKVSLSQRNLRKKKEKPKFKKFKYHQYVPPDQQGKANEQSLPGSDTPYSRLLEQQQLYLRLQIMNQQTLMANQKSSSSNHMQEVKNFVTLPTPPPAPPVVHPPKQEKKKQSFTVQQLEEMKVAELKEELKARKEKVTGTKEVLVERLRRYAVSRHTPVTSNQPINENITGLINATIQSTILANAQQAIAAAAAVGNNGTAGSLLINARTVSPPVQNMQKAQVLQAQMSPPPPTHVTIQIASSQSDSRPVSVVPMETAQNADNGMMSPQNTFHFAPTSNGVQIFNAASMNANTISGGCQLHQTTAAAAQFLNSAVYSAPPTVNLQSTSVPGQRVIAPAPSVQFKVDPSQQIEYTERQKDDLLHKQQREIEDLRRMVELHRTQLQHIQVMKQEMTNTNNNACSSNAVEQKPEQNGLSVAEQTMKRQHTSQILQKHLQSRLNGKDGPPQLINGLTQQTPVKQELPGQMQENVFGYSPSAMPPNVSLVPLHSGDNSSTVHSLQEDAPIILSIKPPVERSLSENKDPPKYDQAIQMLNEEKRRLSHQSFGSQENMTASPGGISDFSDMDELLELLENKGEIPVTPTRQKAFPQAVLIEGRIPQHATMHYHHYNPEQQHTQSQAAAIAAQTKSMDQLQRTMSGNELDNSIQHPQRHSLELPTLIPLSDLSLGYQRKDQGVQRRHSGDLLDAGNARRRHSRDLLSYSNNRNVAGDVPQMTDGRNDFACLLVSSAGDILMDSSQVPPSNLQCHIDRSGCMSPEAVTLGRDPILSGGNLLPHEDPPNHNPYLSLNDPYTTQPFSPMDTGTSDGHSRNGMIEDRVRDPHLSSSSIHDSAHSLDKCLESVSLPQTTGSYLQRYEQPLAGASPQRHSQLLKSSSQELLSDHIQGLEHSMQVDELGWLDLTLSSPHHAPPSPMNSLQQQNRTSMHSSMGSVLEQENSVNPYDLSGEGLGTSHNEFDLIGSLDLNSGIDGWGESL